MDKERSKLGCGGDIVPIFSPIYHPFDVTCQHPLTIKEFGAGCRGLAGKKHDLVFIIRNGLQIEGANSST